jgi:trehalose synthase
MINKKQKRSDLYKRINARVKRLLPNQDELLTRRLASRLVFPERPVQLWDKARHLAKQPFQKPEGRHLGPAVAINSAYIRWLRNQSMLRTAEKQALKYAGKATMWQNPYAKPRPKAALKISSVWYTAYPASIITKGNESILTTLGSDELWQAFEEIGITGLHTGPMKYAGGVDGWKFTPSVDGHFDRISNKIDRLFGTENEFRKLTEAAKHHNSVVIDDLIPGHTGKGFDFRLAEMNYGTYPGIYHMIEVPTADWYLLPDVPAGFDSLNLSTETEAQLKRHGYIIGNASRVLFYEPGVKETNWSVTPPIKGVDGIKRRWVYLHFWKQGQPTINWLDPSFSGMKLVIGDALHSIDQLGSRGLRLDANGLLGIERTSDNAPAWSEGHPLSEAANHIIAGSVRKVGGFTFQEFNVQLDDMQAMGSSGADLSYDFVTRPAYHHALATSNTAFLRLMILEAHKYGIYPTAMVHALQNHDELTYELVHFAGIHKDDFFDYQGKQIKGHELRDIVQTDLRQSLISADEPYNLPYTENGIACTTASAIAAIIGVHNLHTITTQQSQDIQRMHLLLAMFNALQPGVFAVSGWDLRGVLTLDPLKISSLLETGDTRWINRGAYDMMGVDPTANESLSEMPKAPCLYSSLPEQLADPHSFASQLKHILAIREKQALSLAKQIDVPQASNDAVLVLIHQLPGESGIQATILNFSNQALDCRFVSSYLPVGAEVVDALTEESHGIVTSKHGLSLSIKPHQGLSLEFRNL